MSLENQQAVSAGDAQVTAKKLARTGSMSQHSEDSQTAADFLREQMQLEADAREVLPYSISSCTKILGLLRQNVFACLTCNPPPASLAQSFTPAGICYACSVQCHGEHTLVEIFQKRDIACDCGTTRFPNGAECTLRLDEAKGKKGVAGEAPEERNKYNQNFENKFCGCGVDYDPFQQKGTMFQCLGLGTVDSGGCGEDWWHPGCLVGMGEKWWEKMGIEKPTGAKKADKTERVGNENGQRFETIAEEGEAMDENQPADHQEDAVEDDDPPNPPGFPEEDDFEAFLCYKCVESHPWIKKYAGTPGFLPAVFTTQEDTEAVKVETNGDSNKRKAVEEEEGDAKRVKIDTERATNGDQPMATDSTAPTSETSCKASKLPQPPPRPFSLFLKEDFRSHLCRCVECYPRLQVHPQLLDEEEVYEPPLSEDNDDTSEGGSSIYDRGESALKNVDRVRAIEGVMAYNHLKEKLTPFLREFADSGKAVGAEDIKAWFAKIRGDEGREKEAGEMARRDGGEGGDGRKEQSGY